MSDQQQGALKTADGRITRVSIDGMSSEEFIAMCCDVASTHAGRQAKTA